MEIAVVLHRDIPHSSLPSGDFRVPQRADSLQKCREPWSSAGIHAVTERVPSPSMLIA
jgi:hypothetical protein